MLKYLMQLGKTQDTRKDTRKDEIQNPKSPHPKSNIFSPKYKFEIRNLKLKAPNPKAKIPNRIENPNN